LAEKYKIAEAAQLAAWKASEAHKDDEGLKRALEIAEATYNNLDGTVMAVTSLGLLLYMRQRFRRVMQIIFVGILVAGIGATAFAYLANPPAHAKTKESAKKQNTIVQVNPATPKIDVSVNEPKTCVDLYLALDELAHAKPSIDSHWPTTSLGKQDHACGFHREQELARFLSYLAHK